MSCERCRTKPSWSGCSMNIHPWSLRDPGYKWCQRYGVLWTLIVQVFEIDTHTHSNCGSTFVLKMRWSPSWIIISLTKPTLNNLTTSCMFTSYFLYPLAFTSKRWLNGKINVEIIGDELSVDCYNVIMCLWKEIQTYLEQGNKVIYRFLWEYHYKFQNFSSSIHLDLP